MTKTRVAIVTNIVPAYRRGLYRRLAAADDFEFRVFAQDRVPGRNLANAHANLDIPVEEVPLWSWKNHLLWQRLPVRRLRREFDIVIFYGNLRYLSSVIWATVFRLTGANVAVQGQAHTAGGSPMIEIIRLLWWRLFGHVLVYTDYEAQQLQEHGFASKHVVGWNNGLDQHAIDAARDKWSDDGLRAWRIEHGLEDRRLLLSVARLEPKNRFPLALEALAALKPDYPALLWCLIGDGPEQERLKADVERLGLRGHVRFIGAVYEELELAPWFLSAEALLHPGAIGLSLLHAFGYGLPVITHNRRADQMPEFAALRPDENGLTFTPGDASSLAAAIRELLALTADLRARMSVSALDVAHHEFNTDVMAERVLAFVRVMRGEPPAETGPLESGAQ